MQDVALLQRCAQGAVQAVLKVVVTSPQHDMGEEVTVAAMYSGEPTKAGEKKAIEGEINLGEENVRLEGFFGWAATKREGMHDISYDEFLEQLIDVNFESAVQGDEGEDPTTSGGRD